MQGRSILSGYTKGGGGFPIWRRDTERPITCGMPTQAPTHLAFKIFPSETNQLSPFGTKSRKGRESKYHIKAPTARRRAVHFAKNDATVAEIRSTRCPLPWVGRRQLHMHHVDE